MTGAVGLNDAGGVAGWTGGLPEPVGAVVAHHVWTTGSAAPVPPPPVLPEPLASCQFGFTDFATCESRALAINVNQQVVVQLDCLRGNPCFSRQFLLFGAASVTPIPDLITANAINNMPQIVGSVPFGANQHAAIESGGSFVDIGTLGGSASEALGVNDAGAIVGWANLPGDSAAHAFRYANGVMSDLGTLGGASSVANAINSAGTVVGAADVPDGSSHAFVFDGERLVDLGTLGGSRSEATGINDAGQVVGWSEVADPAVSHAFLYSDGTMYDLNDYLTQTLDPLSEGNGINNAGQILVDACYQGAPHPDCQTYLLTPQVAP
jgi:probable HAF family extracellular repeat protein